MEFDQVQAPLLDLNVYLSYRMYNTRKAQGNINIHVYFSVKINEYWGGLIIAHFMVA